MGPVRGSGVCGRQKGGSVVDGNRTNPAILILAGVGALVLILLLIGFLTHGSMMGGMMGGGMMGSGWLLGLLVLFGVIALVVLLARRA